MSREKTNLHDARHDDSTFVTESDLDRKKT